MASTMELYDRYEGIIQKIDRIEKLIEVKESQQLTRRNLFFNFVILLLTLIAGLPGAQQIVAIINSWKIYHFNTLITTQILYISTVVLVTIAIIWQILPTHRSELIIPFDQSHIATKKHFIWPERVKFIPGRNLINTNKSKVSSTRGSSPLSGEKVMRA